jgi:hypothetical protein
MISNYDIFTSLIILFISLIFETLGFGYLNNKFWLTNPLGTITGTLINFLLPTFKMTNTFEQIIKYSNIFLFQNIFYILVFNDFTYMNPLYFTKILIYLVSYIFLDKIGNKMIKKNKNKENIVAFIKSLGVLIIIELLYKDKFDEKTYSSIFKIILAVYFFNLI